MIPTPAAEQCWLFRRREGRDHNGGGTIYRPGQEQRADQGRVRRAGHRPGVPRAGHRPGVRRAGRRTGRLNRRLAGLPAARRRGRAGTPVPAGRQPGALGAPAVHSAGDGGPPGRQTERGPDQHRPRQLGDCRAAPGSPVRRPGVDGKSDAQADASDVPGARWNRSGSARRRRPGLAGQHAPAVPADQLHRCVRAEQQPSAQPGRLEGVHRQRRHEPGARPARPHVGHVLNSAHPDHGQGGRVHHWQGSGGDTGFGGAAHGRLRTHPVQAEHADRAPVPAAHGPADDQQVLHHRPRPRPQHARVLHLAGAPDVRDLLAQPGRAAPGTGI